VVAAFGLAAAVVSGTLAARPAAETPRTVYFSAIDARGMFVTTLTPADLVVKENGQVREVRGLDPATELAHVAVLVDDGGNGLMQSAVARLADAAIGRARLAISMLNPQPYLLNDFAAEAEVLEASIDKIVRRGRLQDDPLQLIEAVSWVAKDLQKRHLSRPVIVAFTNGGEPGWSEAAGFIVDDLRYSGASLHVVYVGGVQMGRVLSEGPAQSGGSSRLGNGIEAFVQAATGIAATLANQYRVTYVLPDGVKPNERLQITSTRPDVTIVAPTRIPN
jgi:hypothetical protein